MKLTFEQIKAVTVGSVDTRLIDGAIHFAKCTEKQCRAWDRKSETLGFRARTTTGIRLDFYTNSQSISFKVLSGRKYDIKVDGLVFSRVGPELGSVVSFELSDPLGHKKDEYRVTVIFSCHEVSVLEYVELDDGAYVKPCEYDKRILFIGDSITQGYASSCDDGDGVVGSAEVGQRY